MPEYTREEQQRIDHADTLARALALGERTVVSPAGQTVYVNEAALEEAQKIAGWQRQNARAREERQAALQAEEQAKVAKRQAERDAAAVAERERFLNSKRLAWSGTAAEFEALKERLWQDELVRRAQDVDLVARKRASVLDGF